ncbi:hypothetical protein C1H46_018689 [Malus baccata]|uniref:Uncharacterized protein n=1 Tax=Malus baccata TaxID=106549 RepID=A0A540MAG9_MALBA|nr:hypothetical protein C1H46_018689 [Malus baccata]
MATLMWQCTDVAVFEIVQIPLDENEVGNLEVSLANDKNAGVPLIEAPPIGAPFWLMSYVARYVCSADLVWLLVFYLAMSRGMISSDFCGTNSLDVYRPQLESSLEEQGITWTVDVDNKSTTVSVISGDQRIIDKASQILELMAKSTVDP